MSAISKAIAKASGDTGNTKPVDSLERQVNAAEFYGQIAPDHPQEQAKRPRGRPPTRNASKSPGPSKVEQAIPEEFPKASKKAQTNKFDEVIYKMNRTRLLTKVQAYNAYWPNICPLGSGEFMQLSNQQLEQLIETFELSVNSYSEIVDVPEAIKSTIANIEPLALQVGAANPTHPYLSQLRLMGGFTRALQTNPNIDLNVKLIAIRLLGRLPRNPYISLLYYVLTTAFKVVKHNASTAEHVPEEYKEL